MHDAPLSLVSISMHFDDHRVLWYSVLALGPHPVLESA